MLGDRLMREALAERQRQEGALATTMTCIFRTDQHCRGRWVFAADMLDARRQAGANDETELLAALDSLELDRPHGVYELPTGHVLFMD